MDSTRRNAIAVSAALMAILVFGVFSLVYLANSASSGQLGEITATVPVETPTGDAAPSSSAGNGAPSPPPSRSGGAAPSGMPGGPAVHGPSTTGSRPNASGTPSSPVATSSTPSDDNGDGNDGTPRSPTEISVTGVRIDGALRDEKCAGFANKQFSVNVGVADVQLVNFYPAGNGLLVNPGCGNASRDCRVGLPWWTTDAQERQSPRRGCLIGVLRGPDSPAPGAGRIGAEVRLRLVATCTSRLGEPCRQLNDDVTPSTDNPIGVTWWENTGVRLER